MINIKVFIVQDLKSYVDLEVRLHPFLAAALDVN